jgi:hypothetical protein
MGYSGRDVALRHFDVATMARKYEALYDSLTTRR